MHRWTRLHAVGTVEMRDARKVYHAESGVTFCNVHFFVIHDDGECGGCTADGASAPRSPRFRGRACHQTMAGAGGRRC